MGAVKGWVFSVAGGLAVVALVAASIVNAPMARAAIVATVPLATSADFVVLAGSAVTNTGPSILNGSLGVAPGTAVSGFGGSPNGSVVPPGTTHINDGVAQLAQSDLTAAYNNAAGRPVTGTTAADLGNTTLIGGVYAAESKGALGLTGTLTLDGQNNANSVFIFQTDSELTTATDSAVVLINGAQACNVFWQIGSSATLGTRTSFAGNILAYTSITLVTGATVLGRALARGGAVTLDTNTFTNAGTCVPAGATGTDDSGVGGTGTGDSGVGGTGTGDSSGGTATGDSSDGTATTSDGTATSGGDGTATGITGSGAGSDSSTDLSRNLPRTGAAEQWEAAVGVLALMLGGLLVLASRRLRESIPVVP